VKGLLAKDGMGITYTARDEVRVRLCQDLMLGRFIYSFFFFLRKPPNLLETQCLGEFNSNSNQTHLNQPFKVFNVT